MENFELLKALFLGLIEGLTEFLPISSTGHLILFGHLIDFQVEQQMKGKNFAEELQRMYTQGRIVPQIWMQRSVGNSISVEPTLKAVDVALNVVK